MTINFIHFDKAQIFGVKTPLIDSCKNQRTNSPHPTPPHTFPGFFAADLDISTRLIVHVLKHESRQKGLDMAHTQDKHFIANLLDATSRILAVDKRTLWQALAEARERGGGGEGLGG
jgi:hypothetical protein